jgi:hypothetical protein
MKFSEIPYFLIKKYLDTLTSFHSNASSVSLIGPKTSIVTNGGDTQNFYLKDNDYGYRKIQLAPYFSNVYNDQNIINFQEALLKSSVENSTLTGNSYSFKTYTLTDMDSHISNGDEVYFRKDSSFHT